MHARFFSPMGVFLFCTALIAGAPAMVGDETARAEPAAKTVVELFTSQGCSSCPPADKLLEKLAARDDVIALTFNVDYWDYLGWKDTLATPANSNRQRSYAHARGDGQVYTPQVIIDGISHAVGSQEKSIERAIRKTRRSLAGRRIPLDIMIEGDTLVIKAGAAPAGTKVKPATIWLALVRRKESVAIKRGENRGRTVDYHSVVHSFTPVGRWTGQQVTIKLPKEHFRSNKNEGCATLLQQDSAGPILAAAELKDW